MNYIQQFMKEALHLFAYNADLSHELGKLVIRHRRQTEHRLFLVGAEDGPKLPTSPSRPDGHILRAAPGLDIRGEAEYRARAVNFNWPLSVSGLIVGGGHE